MSDLKALVVDDTILYRKIVSDVIAGLPGIEVAGTANNGKVALSKIKSLKPDVVTLDIEMPVMSGIEVLENIQDMKNPPRIIMLSTLTFKGGEMTIRALELGAFDFIPKPLSGTMAENKKSVLDALEPIVKTLGRQSLKQSPSLKKPAVSRVVPRKTKAPSGGLLTKPEVIAIGISTGGPNALAKMMPALPRDLSVPVVIVQHMPPLFTQSLAKSLDSKCAITVKEASDGDEMKPGMAFIAPGGKQMKVMRGGPGKNGVIKITDDPPENSCKPSADFLFRSVASQFASKAAGVIMTGMGNDGSKGLQIMKNKGAVIIAQDEPSCTVYGMPKEPIETGVADIVTPLSLIASEIIKTVKK